MKKEAAVGGCLDTAGTAVLELPGMPRAPWTALASPVLWAAPKTRSSSRGFSHRAASLSERKHLSIRYLWKHARLIASVTFRLSKHWSHSAEVDLFPWNWTSLADRPDDQHDEYPPFAICPQAVLSYFCLSAEPASLGHAQNGQAHFQVQTIKNTPTLHRKKIRLLWLRPQQPKGWLPHLPNSVLVLANCRCLLLTIFITVHSYPCNHSGSQHYSCPTS